MNECKPLCGGGSDAVILEAEAVAEAALKVGTSQTCGATSSNHIVCWYRLPITPLPRSVIVYRFSTRHPPHSLLVLTASVIHHTADRCSPRHQSRYIPSWTETNEIL